MSKLLVVKTGSTMPALAQKIGDFEDWMLASMDLCRDRAIVVNVELNEPLPTYDQVAGIVVTGSHSMISDGHEWSDRTAEWLTIAMDKQIPTLGICYGHQLLAYALGGQVDYNPEGREVGTIAITLHPEASDDPLLHGFPPTIDVQLSHRQAVLQLPESVVPLASNAITTHQAFRYGECAWGLQFHPEFDLEMMQAYLEYAWDGLIADGQNPEILLQNLRETPCGWAIMQRFAAIVL